MNPSMRSYYEQRASEYDDWWFGTGLFAERERPCWHEDVVAVCGALRQLVEARTLDLACGTGFLTRFLPGPLVGVDQSPAMVEVGGGEVLHDGPWFVAVRSSIPRS
jgi:demethylmenaquinone methyltransferase/2-methoxy-6-polyprenyl-1,4-benzoquinol methylase